MSDAAFDRLRHVARHLPGDVLTALEVRLGTERSQDRSDAPVDLSVRLETPQQARAVLSPLSHLGRSRGIPALLSDWAGGEAVLRPIHSFWLEFDLDREPGDRLPAPVVCARLRSDAIGDVGGLLQDLLHRLHGDPTTAQGHWIRRGVEAIPPTCRLLYVFTLGARPGGGVRLEVYGESLSTLLGYLEAVDPGLRRTAEPATAVVGDAERLHVSFDVTADGPGRRVGVEGSFRKLPGREPGWADLARRLDDRLSATVPLLDALVAWTGASGNRTGTVLRAVSHVKATRSGNGPVRHKLYLTARHRGTT